MEEPDRLDISFGSVRHVCQLQGASDFQVQARIRIKTGKPLGNPTVKGVEVSSRGWLVQERPGSRTGVRPRQKVFHPLRRLRKKSPAPLPTPRRSRKKSAEAQPLRRLRKKSPVRPEVAPHQAPRRVRTKNVVAEPFPKRARRLRREDLRPIFALLDECDDEPEVCRKMFRAAAHYGLQTPRDERHRHQESIVSTLKEVFVKERASRAHALEEVNIQVFETNARIVEGAGALEAAKAQLEDERDVYNMRLIELERLDQEISAAERGLSKEEEWQERLPHEHEEDKLNKADLDKVFEEVWQPLKDGEWRGREWQKRNKFIRIFMKFFDGSLFEVAGSLRDALPHALKLNALERGGFTQWAIAYAGSVFESYLKTIDQKLFDIDIEAARRSASVENAGGRLADVKAERQACAQHANAAEAAIQQAEAAHRSTEEALGNFTLDLTERKKVLERVKARLINFIERYAEFDTLNDVKGALSAASASGHPPSSLACPSTPPAQKRSPKAQTPEKARRSAIGLQSPRQSPRQGPRQSPRLTARQKLGLEADLGAG